MRKILFLFMILISMQTMGQTVRLANNGKCDAATQVALLRSKMSKNVKQQVSLLAKVSKHFDADALRAQGVAVGKPAGDIVTLRMPVEKLYLVEGNADILQYCLSYKVFPTMNRTRSDTHADSVHLGTGGLPQAYTGEGVIIGITDWGFDYKHPNFNNNGESNRRLLRAWDQFKLSGPAPAGFDYGTVFENRHDLLQAQGDTAGLYGYATHGTHVAGICAGRGIDGNYTGQAPYANLLFASFRLDCASWLDAVSWMKDVAKEEGKRLVINNSWGMYTLGPIDGTSLASQAINNLADSGIVFVVSAGNCGDDKFHLTKTFTAGSPDTLRTMADYYPSTSIGQALVLWGEPGKDFSTSFAMISSTDTVTFPWVNTAEGSFYLDTMIVNGTDTLHYDILVEQANVFNNRPHVLYNVYKNARYKIHLFATAEEGTLHAWNICDLENGAGNMGTSFSGNGTEAYMSGDNGYGVGEPACAENCIAVAAHRADGVKPNGEPNPGVLASFSSHGPIIDGRHKPDVSAPGVDVVSSISSYTDEAYVTVMSYTYAARNYIWAKMSGTSMSGPAVTGIVALMLQANPNLTPYQVRDILCKTARNDANTGLLHDNDSISDRWGWGKADALAAVNEALARVDIREADNEWFSKSLQVYPNPASERITILTGRHNVEEVAIYTITGVRVKTQEIVMEGTMDISQLPHGIYIVKCGARTTRLVH